MNKLVIDWCPPRPAYLYVLFSFTLVQVMRTIVSHTIRLGPDLMSGRVSPIGAST
jgi:hypothetical protein